MTMFEQAARCMLTTEEAAHELGVKESTVRAWIARRRLGFVKLGRCVRIPRSELERIVRQGTVPAREAR